MSESRVGKRTRRIGTALPEVVAANVRAEVARRALSRTQLAAMLNMSYMAVGDRYRGRTDWTLADLDHLSKILAVPVDALTAPPPTLPAGQGTGDEGDRP